MRKSLKSLLYTGCFVLAGTAPAFAGNGGGYAPSVTIAAALAAAFAMAISAFAGTLAQGRAIAATQEAIARNPVVANKLSTTMIIGLALIEAIVIYALVVALLLIFMFK